MSNFTKSVIRRALRKENSTLNVLTAPTHEAYQSNFSSMPHTFYMWQSKGIKDWKTTYRPLPKNHVLLNPALGESQIPNHLSFDLVLSQNKFGQFQILSQFARKYHLPLISLEHTLPMSQWSSEDLKRLKNMSGNVNVFISEDSRRRWGWGDREALVVRHGLDTNFWCSVDENQNRKPVLLSVCNDWINRNEPCGFQWWQRATHDLPRKPVGDTPGLSQPAKSVLELRELYRQHAIFVNTSQVSPIPMSLLEAAACGCALVSTNNCMIPEIFTHEIYRAKKIFT